MMILPRWITIDIYEMVVENRYDDITKMDYNRYYKKEQCKTCNGTGYVQLNS